MASNTSNSGSNNQNQGQQPSPQAQAFLEFLQSLSNQAQHSGTGGGVDRAADNTNNQWMFGPSAWSGMWGPHARSGPWEQGHRGQWPGPPPPFPPHNNGPNNDFERGADGEDGSEGGRHDNHEDSPDTMPIDDNEHPPHMGSTHPPPPPPPPNAPIPPFPHHFRPSGPGSPGGHRRGGRDGGHHGRGGRGCRGGRGGGHGGGHGMFPFPPPPPPHGGPGMPGWLNFPNMFNGSFRNIVEQMGQYAADAGRARQQQQQEQQQQDDSFKPPVDIFNRPGEWQVHIALPGAKKEDIGLNWDAERGSLRIAGVVHRPGDEEFLQSLVSGERRVGMFERFVAIPPPGTDESEEPDGDRISAKLENGVLVVTVPKSEREWTEVRSIDIE